MDEIQPKRRKEIPHKANTSSRKSAHQLGDLEEEEEREEKCITFGNDDVV